MPFDDRDPKFERALAQHLRGNPAEANCPDAETLAAYHERNLSLEEMARWKEHISACQVCQEALALVETTENQLAEDWEERRVPEFESVAAPRGLAASDPKRTAQAAASSVAILRRRPALLRWAIPLGALAAGVLVFIGIYEQRMQKMAQSSGAVVARREAPATPAPMLDKLQSKVQAPSESKDSKDQELATAEKSVPKKERAILAAPSPRPADGMRSGGGAGLGNAKSEYDAAENKKAATPPAPAPDTSASFSAGAGTGVSQNAPIRATGGGSIGATAGGGFVNLPINGRNVVGLMTLSSGVVLAPNQIGGVVTDPSGAAIASAIVEVKNIATNATWSASTSSDGRWLLPNLPSGTYQLSAHAPGFQTMLSTIAYDAANPRAYQIGLNVGAVTETVEVSAQSVSVDTESAQIGGRKKKKNKNAAQPAAPPPPPEPMTYGAAVGGAAGEEKHTADLKTVPPSVSQGVTVQTEEAPLNRRNDSLMMKQGVSNELAKSAGTLSGLILTPDNRVFWKLQPAGTVQLTTDGGKDWKSLETGANEYLTTGFAPSSNVCWIAGRAGTLVLTADRGGHWSKIATPITGDLGGVHAADAKHASIWDASRHTSYETSDGGSTWKQTTNQ
jgi:hypothetical protein